MDDHSFCRCALTITRTHFRARARTHTLTGRVRYVLRVIMSRNYAPKVRDELELWVQNHTTEPEMNNPINMEVRANACVRACVRVCLRFRWNEDAAPPRTWGHCPPPSP